MNKALIAALVAATALLAPAAAQAATVSLDESGALVYQGEGSEGLSLLVTTFQPFEDPSTYLALSDSGADRHVIMPGTPASRTRTSARAVSA